MARKNKETGKLVVKVPASMNQKLCVKTFIDKVTARLPVLTSFWLAHERLTKWFFD